MSHDIGPEEVPEDDPREPAGPPPGRRTRVWALLLAILGVIVILALSAWLAMSGGEDAPAEDPGDAAVEMVKPVLLAAEHAEAGTS